MVEFGSPEDTGYIPGPVFNDAVPVLIGITCTFGLLATLLLGMRTYVRVTRHNFGIDDWFMAVGWAFYIALMILSLGAAVRGLGLKDANFSSLAHLQRAAKWLFFTQLFYILSIFCVKCSICLTLLRFVTSRLYTAIIYGVIALLAIMSIMPTVLMFISCAPVSFHWNMSGEGSCDHEELQQAGFLAYTIISVLTDVFCALFPVVILWNVQMNQRTKLGVGVLLGMGVVACICSIIRLHGLIAPDFLNDYLYQSTYVLIWAILEVGIGIIASSAAASRPLFRSFLQVASFKSYTGKSSFGGQVLADHPPPLAGRLPHQMKKSSLNDDEYLISGVESASGGVKTQDSKEKSFTQFTSF